MGVRARRLVVALIAMAAGTALGASVTPTMSAWLDKGGATMSITAIGQAPPEPVGPVYPGPGTDFEPPAWSGPNAEGNPEPTNVCFTVEITTDSSTPVAWIVMIETDQPPFNNVPPFVYPPGFRGQFFGWEQSYNFAPAVDYATTGRYQMTPTATHQYASETVSYTATACAVNVPEPAWQPPGPDTYTQRDTLTLMRNGVMPCVAGTVDGNAPYYVGFTLSFDWMLFLDEQLTAGAISQAERDQWITYTHWAGGPPGYVNQAQGATGADYLVTLQGYASFSRNVAYYAPVEIASCAY